MSGVEICGEQVDDIIDGIQNAVPGHPRILFDRRGAPRVPEARGVGEVETDQPGSLQQGAGADVSRFEDAGPHGLVLTDLAPRHEGPAKTGRPDCSTLQEAQDLPLAY